MNIILNPLKLFYNETKEGESFMKIAFERLDISPALPVRLSGFGAVRWANKIHDPIYARLFLFNNEKEESSIYLCS